MKKGEIITLWICIILISVIIAGFTTMYYSMIQNYANAETYEFECIVTELNLVVDGKNYERTHIVLCNGTSYILQGWHNIQLFTPIKLTLQEFYKGSNEYHLKDWELI